MSKGKPLYLPPGSQEAAERWRNGQVTEDLPRDPERNEEARALIAGLVLALGGQKTAAAVLGCSPGLLREWVAGRSPLPDKMRWGGMLWWGRLALGETGRSER